MKRRGGRRPDALREISIQKSFLRNAHGSALITWGNTRVICTAMAVPGVPPFLEGTGKGWLTAEYAMLPGSTPQRKSREKGRPDGTKHRDRPSDWALFAQCFRHFGSAGLHDKHRLRRDRRGRRARGRRPLPAPMWRCVSASVRCLATALIEKTPIRGRHRGGQLRHCRRCAAV